MTPPRSVEEHVDHVNRLLEPLSAQPDVETVLLAHAAGRVAAADVRSDVDLPLFRNSQMDGYAVRAADVAHVPVALEVTGDVPAGHEVPVSLTPGTAIRIMTGAPVPSGADAIVPVEDTELVLGRDDDLFGAVVEIRRSRKRGEYVRERGSDLERGDVLVTAGTRLAARHLAALAAAGVSSVAVRARLRVAVLTTGSELAAPGRGVRFGQVFDANGVALAALVEESGAVVSLRASSSDDPEAFARVFDAAVAASDLVVTSGGISKGAYEVVREVLLPRGAEVTTVAMQPGGPQATAVVDGVPVLCFPGNPVSTQVSFAVFLRGPLRDAAGLPALPVRRVRLAESVRSVPGKRQFLRGRVGEDGVAPVSGPSSHLVAAMATADVLIDLPAEAEAVESGADVTVWTL
ncbi:gephyrin-like molybdotransferase Glp [Leifsonia sp. NPDC056665]|uniref:molybdopterin molybdotransferase MoeA n=1 Tax=Leifsonia sp. NPDC056665 TaxID=3345901 RepID=UPI0036D1DD9E